MDVEYRLQVHVKKFGERHVGIFLGYTSGVIAFDLVVTDEIHFYTEVYAYQARLADRPLDPPERFKKKRTHRGKGGRKLRSRQNLQNEDRRAQRDDQPGLQNDLPNDSDVA